MSAAVTPTEPYSRLATSEPSGPMMHVAEPWSAAATLDAATKTVFSSARQSSAFSLYGFEASHQRLGSRP
jgi:hypothetical protein